MIVCLSVRTLIYANSIKNTPLDSFLEKFEKELKRYGTQMKLERELKEYGSPMKLERELKGYGSSFFEQRPQKQLKPPPHLKVVKTDGSTANITV